MTHGHGWVTNTEGVAVSANLLFHLATPRSGFVYVASASVAYKEKRKAAACSVTRVVPVHGGVDVSVNVGCPTARTTNVVVEQAAAN